MTRSLPSFRFLTSAFLRLICLLAVLAWPAAAAAQDGTVSGVVTEAGGTTPLVNTSVYVVDVRTSFIAFGSTNASGAYSIQVPPGALYYLVAVDDNHVATAHPTIACFNAPSLCSSDELLAATPFAMPPGGTVAGKNFSLQRAGRITGTVTSTAGGAPIPGALVGIFRRVGTSGSGIGFNTNASGVYTASGLPPGTYYIATFLSNTQGFQNEIYDNTPCIAGCSTAAILSSTPVVVTAGATTSGKDFALDPGGRISGVVTNAATGTPVQNVSVQAYTRVGTSILFAGSANTNGAGEYTILGLGAATYFLLTSSSTTTNEIYPDLLCPLGCSSTTAVNSGTGVPVTLNATTPNVNFALSPGGSISGNVTNQATNNPAASVQVVAAIRLGTSVATRAASTDLSGNYTILGLPAGTYALFTNSSSWINEIFDNQPCATPLCNSTTAVQTGTPVNVTTGAVTPARNFALQPLTVASTGRISGTVTDNGNGLPISGITLEIDLIVGSTSQRLTTIATNVLGQYSVSGLLPGTYRVATLGNHLYRNEAFENFPCLGTACSTTIILGATPISVAAGGTATVNFGLSSGDGIDGFVTDAATGNPLGGVTVSFMQVPSGAFVGTFSTNGAGRYVARGLPNGQYVVFTSNALGYFDEIYDNLRCAPICNIATALSSGTRITLNGAAAFAGPDLAQLASGINIALDVRNDAPTAPTNLRIVTSGGTALFAWTAPSLAGGGVPTSYLLEAGLSPGTTFVTLPMPGTGTTFSVPGVPAGTYFVRVRGVNAGGTGPASNEVTLVVGAGGTGRPDPPTSLNAFMVGPLLTMTWIPPAGGGPPTGYVVEAGSASGLANLASLSVSGNSFTFDGVPAGFYFLRVRSRNAAGLSSPSTETMIVVGNGPAPPGAPTFSSHTVSSGTVTLNWTAPTFGTATSYIIEAGSATGLSNLATVNTGNTAVTLSFSGVPPGTYYVRIRAVNAQGASVVSNERIITVS